MSYANEAAKAFSRSHKLRSLFETDIYKQASKEELVGREEDIGRPLIVGKRCPELSKSKYLEQSFSCSLLKKLKNSESRRLELPPPPSSP